MGLARDLISIGEDVEEALRFGDSGPQYLTNFGGSTQALATVIGGPTGATLLELNPTSASVSSVIFSAVTELDREYSLDNGSGLAMNVFPPVGGNFQGLGANLSFSLPANKVAFITRIGPIPPVTGSIASDRWVYLLSN
jgi:hypothetical protein